MASSHSIPLNNLEVRDPVGRAECHTLGVPVVYSWQYFQLVGAQVKYFDQSIAL